MRFIKLVGRKEAVFTIGFLRFLRLVLDLFCTKKLFSRVSVFIGKSGGNQSMLDASEKATHKGFNITEMYVIV